MKLQWFLPGLFLLIQGCGNTYVKGLSEDEARNIPAVMQAQADIKCTTLMDSAVIAKGTLLEALDITGIEYYYDGYSTSTFPENSLYLKMNVYNMDMMSSDNGPVIYPDGNFVFKDATYFVYSFMLGKYVHQPGSRCTYSGSQTPFKMVKR